MRSTSCLRRDLRRRICPRRESTRFLALSDGALAPFEPLVDSGDSEGAALGVSAEEDGFRFATRSLLDPERSDDAGGFFAAFKPFEPALTAELAPDTLAYVGFGDADETVGALLDQATIRAPDIATGITEQIDRLRKSAGVDLAADLLPALNGEGASGARPAARAATAASAAAPEDDEVARRASSPRMHRRRSSPASQTSHTSSSSPMTWMKRPP